MTARKRSPLHEKWHRRVEGQIRDCMHFHPEYFAELSDRQRLNYINGLAKRIVGEIVAGIRLAAVTEHNGTPTVMPGGS